MRSPAARWIVLAAALGVGIGVARSASSSAPALAPALGPGSTPGFSERRVDFIREVRPILSDHCYACHGPDEQARKAKLRLDRREDIVRPLASGRVAVVPGEPAGSTLVARIVTSDPDDVMPPPSTGKPLTARQKGLLERWIQEGADWPTHWGFVAPERSPLPPVHDRRWPRNEIDRFVLARLEQEGLTPSPEADRATLVRRASLDLTGLPPTVEEIDAFLADKSPGAYDTLVDRLLESPRYGEHMARYWLDAVRYADTHGYHIDAERSMWKYRDWVVESFNRNLPFDQFTTAQLAGDLLPHAGLEEKVASGYLRANMSTGEGGAIVEEYQAKYTFDRVETTGTIWMGLTLTCARCHTHKYDPISQREYYGLFDLFNDLSESVMDGNQPNPAPTLRVPSAAQTARIEELKRRLAEGEPALEAPQPSLDAAQSVWEGEWRARLAVGWAHLTPAEVGSGGDGQLGYLGDGSLLVAGEAPAKDVHELVFKPPAGRWAGLRLEAWPHPALPRGGSARSPDGVELSELEADWVRVGADGRAGEAKKVGFARVASTFAPDGEAALAIDGKLDTAWRWPAGAAARAQSAVFVFAEPLEVSPDVEVRVRLRFEGGGQRALGRYRFAVATGDELRALLVPPKADPWQVIGPFKKSDLRTGFETVYPPETEFERGKAYPGVREEIRWQARPEFEDGRAHQLVHELHGVHGVYYLRRVWAHPAAGRVEWKVRADDLFKVWVDGELVAERAEPERLGEGPVRVAFELPAGEHVVLFKIVNHQGACGFTFTPVPADARTLAPEVAAWLALDAEPASEGRRRVRHFYRRLHDAEYKRRADQVERWREERQTIEEAIPSTLIAQELEQPRATFVLRRGEYDQPGERVAAGVPAFLPAWPAGAPTNRLGFARWLLDGAHPLTARVTVNRLWQQCFGTGLVKTTEDFGVQGEFPSHPALLDWLATEFRESGWNVKRLQRLLVTSATYRQASGASAELQARDPENRWLARGPRFRTDAEVVRDTALAVSGLLVEARGGRSVKPYEPPGLWEAVSFNSSQKYVPDVGDGGHRRSVYTFWKRQSPPPGMMLFDAPTREFCVVRRPRTNTPLQALALLNDPQWVEAACAFAQRMLAEGGVTTEQRLAYGFRLATARPPTREELAVLRGVLEGQLAEYRTAPAAARDFLASGAFPVDAVHDAVELAAWSAVASLLLNLDETLTKG